MIQNSYLINQILQNYEAKQSYNREMDYYAEQKLLADKEYSDVYYALKSVNIDLQKAEYFNDTDNINRLKEEKSTLTAKKTEIERRLGGAKREITYDCPTCKDTGKTQSGLCHCFFEHLTSLAYDELEVRKHHLNDFSDDTLSETSGNQKLYKKLKSYASNFSLSSMSLIFTGNTGTGKTFLSSAIANEVSKSNYNVIFLTACELNRVLIEYHTATISRKNVIFDILTQCDLLVIDDLGTEPLFKNVTVEYLLSIISERSAYSRPYIISTNLSAENILERYGERLFSRLKSKKNATLMFNGADLR